MNSQGTILAVDDTHASLKLLADILTAEGYRVRPADSGELALAAVAANPPELILLDIRMPGLDGFEVFRQLKARAESRDIPIIFLSAHTEMEQQVEGLKLGAVDFISKPFQREELLARVQTHLELFRLRLRLEQQATSLRLANEQLQLEIAERQRAGETLRESEARMRLQTTALESAANGVAITDRQGTIQWVNPAFTQLTGYSAEIAIGQNPRILKSGQHPAPFYQKLWETISAGHVWKGEIVNRHKDGRLYHEEMIVTPVRDTSGAIVHFIAIKQDITARKQADAALEKVNRELVDASRQAGMAEVATSVLHNVGNVLNSVNVSTILVADHVRHTKAGNVARLAALFDQHKADLATFLTQDARGQTIPAYLGTLAESLDAEQKTLLAELDHLRDNVEHIKDIVAMQQAYAQTSGVIETISVPDLIEDALRVNADALSRHDVATIRDYQASPSIITDKHKVMQILINLLHNAQYACDESGRTDKQITVRTTSDDHRVKIAIGDNGVGIPAENLTRIFNHGFTTRKTGHGFALHSGALAAKELGGSLTVHSDGPGLGATFILELPRQPDTPAHENSAH